MPTRKRKVFIALKMAGIAGQDKLAGVFRYLNERYTERSPWEVQLVRTKSELTADVLRSALMDGTDGFIVSIPDTEDAVGPLAETAIPAINTKKSTIALFIFCMTPMPPIYLNAR